MPAQYVTVSGSIATGKTTLCKMLGEMLSIPVFYEEASQNPFLPDFYADDLDIPRYAFHSQMWFLNYKHQQLQKIANARQPVVMERCLDENLIFFQLVLSNEENKIYADYYQLVAESVLALKPILIVYLRVSVTEQLWRIMQRTISYEQAIDEQYLKELNSKYEEWVSSCQQTPVLSFDSEQIQLRKVVRGTCLKVRRHLARQ